MNTPNKIAILAAGALCLSGCSSIFGGSQMARANADELDIQEIYHDYAAEQLALGRAQLRAGAYASALESLRRASRDPQSAPAAYNAMGVAYAKLGRQETAVRFFRLALMLDPENRSFASNLTRLKGQFRNDSEVSGQQLAANASGQDESAASARVADASEEQQAEEAARIRTVKSAFGAEIRVGAGTGQIQRLSTYEVRIGGPRHSARGQRRVVARSDYPVRVQVSPSQGEAKAAPSDKGAYPVQVRF